MLPAILATLTIMAQPSPADDVIWVYRLDASLEIARKVWWRAKGHIAGKLYFTPAEEIVGFVTAERVEFVRWTADGKELLRRPVELTESIVTYRLNADGTLTVVTSRALVKLGPDGRILARRALNVRFGERDTVAASPGGAWFALPERLVFEGFDGRETVKPAPLGVEERECDKEESRRDLCPAYIPLREMLATERDECLLVETIAKSHEIAGGGTDTTRKSVLSLFRPDGQLLARRTLGKTEMKLEWFWSENHGSQSLAPSIPDFGLVRRRYYGETDVWGLVEKPNGDFVAIVIGSGIGLTRFDRELRELWGVDSHNAGSGMISPPWTKGFLFFSTRAEWPSLTRMHGVRSNEFHAFDDQGGSYRWTSREIPENERDPKPTGVAEKTMYDEWAVSFRGAIGQSPSGEWMVAVY
jgi:hypothetical protein